MKQKGKGPIAGAQHRSGQIRGGGSSRQAQGLEVFAAEQHLRWTWHSSRKLQGSEANALQMCLDFTEGDGVIGGLQTADIFIEKDSLRHG